MTCDHQLISRSVTPDGEHYYKCVQCGDNFRLPAEWKPTPSECECYSCTKSAAMKEMNDKLSCHKEKSLYACCWESRNVGRECPNHPKPKDTPSEKCKRCEFGCYMINNQPCPCSCHKEKCGFFSQVKAGCEKKLDEFLESRHPELPKSYTDKDTPSSCEHHEVVKTRDGKWTCRGTKEQLCGIKFMPETPEPECKHVWENCPNTPNCLNVQQCKVCNACRSRPPEPTKECKERCKHYGLSTLEKKWGVTCPQCGESGREYFTKEEIDELLSHAGARMDLLDGNIKKLIGLSEERGLTLAAEEKAFRKELLDFLNHRVIACLKPKQYKIALEAWQRLWNKFL